MIKKIALSLALCTSIISIAQEATSSPYSYYGIGDIKFKGTVENRSMGGMNIFADSIHLNMQNPASYASLLITTFSLGGGNNATTLASSSKTAKTSRATLDYLAVGLPMGKFGASFGLIPYASVGYRMTDSSVTDSYKRFTGTGGVNKVYLGIAYKINKNWNIGANLDYNFGKTTTDVLEYRNTIQLGTEEKNISNASGLNLTAGLLYKGKINNKLQITGGLTYAPESKINFDNTRTLSTVLYSNGSENVVDKSADILSNIAVTIPSKATFGIGIGESKKWEIGTEIAWQNASKTGNRFNDAFANVSFENATKYSLGGYYIPKYNSFTKYFERVVYRAGINYQNTGLVINNTPIKDQSISVGAGLPLYGVFSNINIGFEYGQKGTKDAGLIQENYTNITIGLSLNDRWFIKRKYD